MTLLEQIRDAHRKLDRKRALNNYLKAERDLEKSKAKVAECRQVVIDLAREA